VDDNSTLAQIYWKNKNRKQKLHGNHINERNDQSSKFTSEEDKDKVFAYVSKKLQGKYFEKIYRESQK
jgi:hypothetical protein